MVGSVALGGFGPDSLIEIGASIVVVWDLSGNRDEVRQRRALRLIGVTFAGLAAYLLMQSTVVLAIGHHPRHSLLGIAWTARPGLVAHTAGHRGPCGRTRRTSPQSPAVVWSGLVCNAARV